MNDQFHSSKHFRDLAAALDASKQMRELAAALDTTKQMRELAAAFDVSKQMRDMAAAFDVSKQMREMAAAFDVSKQMRDAAAALDTTKQLRDLAAQLTRTQVLRWTHGVATAASGPAYRSCSKPCRRHVVAGRRNPRVALRTPAAGAAAALSTGPGSAMGNDRRVQQLCRSDSPGTSRQTDHRAAGDSHGSERDDRRSSEQRLVSLRTSASRARGRDAS